MFSQMMSELRARRGLKLREISAISGIDQGLINKYEKGKRMAPEAHLGPLAKAYQVDVAELRKAWLAEKVSDLLRYEEMPHEVWMLAEERIEYLKSHSTAALPELDQAIQAQLDEIDALREIWLSKRPKPGIAEHKMMEYIYTEYTYESNRIEGNTLTLAETHMVVAEGLTIGGKSVNEHLEAINHQKAIGYVEELLQSKVKVDRRTITDLHRLVLAGIDDEHAGRWRKVPVRIGGSRHTPPQPYMLDKLMEDYTAFFQQRGGQLHPVIRAAEAHERLVSIHPFIDGNGRTSRLIMNLVLLSEGYTIANLRGDKASRLQYYGALEAVQVDGDPMPFYRLVLAEVKRSLENHISMC